MDYRTSVPPIHIPLQTSTDASINAIYYGSPSISSMHLVGSEASYYTSFLIPSTNCLTAVYFYRFINDGSRPSNSFTVVNIPFDTDMPIFLWRHLTITGRNILKYTLFLRLIIFRDSQILSCLSRASYMHISAPSKIHPSTSFLFSRRP